MSYLEISVSDDCLKTIRDQAICTSGAQTNSTITLVDNIYYDVGDKFYTLSQLIQSIDYITSYSKYSEQIIKFAAKHTNSLPLPLIVLSDSDKLEPYFTANHITAGNFANNKGKALFIHELTHYVMYLLFDNQAKPYPYEGHYIYEAYKGAFEKTVHNFAELVKLKLSSNSVLQEEFNIISNSYSDIYKKIERIESGCKKDCFNLISDFSNEMEANIQYTCLTTLTLALASSTISEHDRYLFSRLGNFAASCREHDEELIVLLPEFYSLDTINAEERETLKPLEDFWHNYISPLLEGSV